MKQFPTIVAFVLSMFFVDRALCQQVDLSTNLLAIPRFTAHIRGETQLADRFGFAVGLAIMPKDTRRLSHHYDSRGMAVSGQLRAYSQAGLIGLYFGVEAKHLDTQYDLKYTGLDAQNRIPATLLSTDRKKENRKIIRGILGYKYVLANGILLDVTSFLGIARERSTYLEKSNPRLRQVIEDKDLISIGLQLSIGFRFGSF